MSRPNIIATTHDASGTSVFTSELPYQQINPAVGVIYSTPDGKPIDLNNGADIAAFATRNHSTPLPKEGSIVLVAELPPGADTREHTHRTPTVDIGVMLKGELECHLDNGEHRLIKQGDVLVQRGTMHFWINPSKTESASILITVLPSRPVDGAKP